MISDVELDLSNSSVVYIVGNTFNKLSQEHWQWKVGSFAIWLSWMELLLLIQKLPKGTDKL